MPGQENQRAVFDFLVQHFHSQQPFTKNDVHQLTDWSEKSFQTYWSKQYKRLVVSAGGDTFRVSESFLPFATWESFQRDVVTQVRRASIDYTSERYDNVIIYEFFMPLTNEAQLRTALDSLFFKDTLLRRLKTLDENTIHTHIPKKPDELKPVYLDRVCEWIANHFVGYSISQVNGRFRAAPLATFGEAATKQQTGQRYLIDETTAITRFIFRCGTPHIMRPPLSSMHFEEWDVESTSDPLKDVDAIRWFFGILFVQGIIQAVNGEDEIWMVESGLRNRLHIWKAGD